MNINNNNINNNIDNNKKNKPLNSITNHTRGFSYNSNSYNVTCHPNCEETPEFRVASTPELVLKIFTYLPDFETFLNVRKTCPQFNRIACDPHIWEVMTKRFGFLEFNYPNDFSRTYEGTDPYPFVLCTYWNNVININKIYLELKSSDSTDEVFKKFSISKSTSKIIKYFTKNTPFETKIAVVKSLIEDKNCAIQSMINHCSKKARKNNTCSRVLNIFLSLGVNYSYPVLENEKTGTPTSLISQIFDHKNQRSLELLLARESFLPFSNNNHHPIVKYRGSEKYKKILLQLIDSGKMDLNLQLPNRKSVFWWLLKYNSIDVMKYISEKSIDLDKYDSIHMAEAFSIAIFHRDKRVMEALLNHKNFNGYAALWSENNTVMNHPINQLMINSINNGYAGHGETMSRIMILLQSGKFSDYPINKEFDKERGFSILSWACLGSDENLQQLLKYTDVNYDELDHRIISNIFFYATIRRKTFLVDKIMNSGHVEFNNYLLPPIHVEARLKQQNDRYMSYKVERGCVFFPKAYSEFINSANNVSWKFGTTTITKKVKNTSLFSLVDKVKLVEVKEYKIYIFAK